MFESLLFIPTGIVNCSVLLCMLDFGFFSYCFLLAKDFSVDLIITSLETVAHILLISLTSQLVQIDLCSLYFLPPVLETNSVEIVFPPSGVNLCDNNPQVQVTCRVSRENVSPAPVISLLSERLTFNIQGYVTGNRNHYQQQFTPNPTAIAGEYQVTCRVTNTFINTEEKGLATVRYIGELAGNLAWK